MADTAYNPNDSVQTNFLGALATVESGSNTSGNLFLGNSGGGNLQGNSTDAYGFPIWSGVGNSHAAGIFQFQPGTWDEVAKKYGLNFGSASDQEAAAWYHASDIYSAKTNGGSLESALQNGQYSQVQQALGSTWIGANRPTFLQMLKSGAGQAMNLTGSAPSDTSNSDGSSGSNSSDGWTFTNVLQRFGLIIIGTILVVIAIWKLLADNKVIPGPVQTIKAATAVL